MALLDNRHPDRADMGGGADVHERWGSGMNYSEERLALVRRIVKILSPKAEPTDEQLKRMLWLNELRKMKKRAAIREGGKDE